MDFYTRILSDRVVSLRYSGGEILEEVKRFLGSDVYTSTDIVQSFNTCICGQLCLYVLKSLGNDTAFRSALAGIPDPSLGIPAELPRAEHLVTSMIGHGLRAAPVYTEDGKAIQWSSKLADELHRRTRHRFQKTFCVCASAS